jgi:hypothetical protein
VFGNLPFNTQYYFHRTLFYLTTPLFAVLLYLFGDNPEHFNLIYIAALSLSCVFCWSDKDTLGALLILLGLWCVTHLLYTLPRSTTVMFLIYAVCLAISIYRFKQVSTKITLAIILVSIGSEFFWWNTSYSNKPHIFYFVGLLTLTDIARELLFKRVFLMSQYFGHQSGKIALDWQLRSVLLAGYGLIAIMLLEYFLRHLAGLKDMTVVYYNFTLVANLLSGITLTTIYMHYFYNQSKKHLPA